MKKFSKALGSCLLGFNDDVDITEVQLGPLINDRINDQIINGILNEVGN